MHLCALRTNTVIYLLLFEYYEQIATVTGNVRLDGNSINGPGNESTQNNECLFFCVSKSSQYTSIAQKGSTGNKHR